MPLAAILLIFGLFVIIAIAGAWFERKRERERTEALARVAERLGWSFSGEDEDSGFSDTHEQFECFRRGHTRYAHNRLRGRMDAFGHVLRSEAGDYHYRITRRNGKSSTTTTYRFSYLLVSLPFGTRLPGVTLRAEGLFDKLAGAVGFEDIDFESAEFSRRYHVNGTDRRFVYDLIHPRMIEWMLEDPPPYLEINSGVLLLVSNEATDRWGPDEFHAAVQWTEGFLSRWPDYLVRDLAAR
jgi:hypothetical protein